jgi:anion-transporting  ArsA/GET3 family ATPase
MTPILVFTGSAGPGIAIAAAATAIRAAQQGRKTLLLSFGPAHSLAALLGAEVRNTPTMIAPGLDALAGDTPADLAAAWERGRARLPPQLAQIAGDELPLLPGLELPFGLLRLSELAARYELVALDAGPHDALLRALALPDGLRWIVRLLLGLDRGPGSSGASVARALLPTSFLPIDALEGIQNLRVQSERLRDVLTTARGAEARFVLRADGPALEEARLAIPALQLHGLAVPALLGGPLLPHLLAGTAYAAAEEAILAEAGTTWPARPLARFELPERYGALAALDAIGARLDLAAPPARDPITRAWEGAPAVAIELPGLPKGGLQLTLSGDELIVRVGEYRRHILLPEGLRGTNSIRATREGEHLIVRRRNS